jgi:RecB family exonuclease
MPRVFRLVRAAGPRSALRALASLAAAGGPAAAPDRAVIVPTRPAAREARRTIERVWIVERAQRSSILPRTPGLPARPEQAASVWTLGDDAGARAVEAGAVAPASVAGDGASDVEAGGAEALVLPHLLTRDEFYDSLYARAGFDRPLLSALERQAVAWRAADTAAARGAPPPFALRPGLVAEVLALYDTLRRSNRTIADFTRVMTEALEPGAETDHGARRLLDQTRFLDAVFREYEATLEARGALDEHRLREGVIAAGLARPWRHVILTVADQAAEPDGLWPADFDLLARLPGLARLDVIATAALLDTGLRERLLDLLPGIEEEPWADEEGPPPCLVCDNTGDSRIFVARDREEELAGIVRRLLAEPSDAVCRGPAMPEEAATPGGTGALEEASRPGKSARPAPAASRGRPPLDETLIVYQRPLPYVYLAERLFARHGLVCDRADALPLAAEPFAAAADTLCEVVVSGYARDALLDALATPHFSWLPERAPLARAERQALAEWLVQQGFAAGRDACAAILSRAAAGGGRLRRAVAALAGLLDDLAVFDEPAWLSSHAGALAAMLARRERPMAGATERHLRARAAVRATLDALASAYAGPDDRQVEFREMVAVLRRALEQQTFATAASGSGVRLVDARAARYAACDAAFLVGLVEGEWPAASRPNIFYPAPLLRDLGWPGDAGRLAAARARWEDLLRLPRGRVSVSTFQLEDDAIVRPSVLLEDLEEAGLPVLAIPEDAAATAAAPAAGGEGEAGSAGGDRAGAAVDAGAATRVWIAIREGRPPAGDPRFHGAAGPVPPGPYPVTAVERYVDCPFKYFAGRVLRLGEEPEDEIGLTPRERGTLVHRVFEQFFTRWTEAGEGAIAPARLPAARQLFADVVDAELAALPEADRLIERTRLLGSAVAPGLGERVFRLEASRPVPVVERLLEQPLGGRYDLGRADGRPVDLTGVADRIDLLADGTLRVLDYKIGRAPDVGRSVQLGIYALCAERQLEGRHGRSWRTGLAAYVTPAAAEPWVAAVEQDDDRRPLEAARERFLDAIAGIERGEFPPRPADRRLCRTCAYAAVCRKDYVGAD